MHADAPEPVDGPSAAASPQGAGHAAFDRLHPGVQRQLYQMKWPSLRPLQVRAIHHLMGCDHDAILAAATASGKTEAAFLPLLSRIAEEATGSVRVVYVGPLKALINDQFQRVEDLCAHLEVPVFRWHGDVELSHKSKLTRQPGGVLLITPESVESLFINRSHFLTRLFGGLRYIVIDELHSFLANERGLQLRSLLHRLRRIAGAAPQAQPPSRCITVGLSATIGDFEIARRFVCPENPESVALLRDDDDSKEIGLRLYGYRRVRPAEPAEDGEMLPDPARDTMARDIVKHCGRHANLIFANSKGDVEEMADLCSQFAERDATGTRIYVHHGALSAEIREDTEAAMKSGSGATTICSSTLEMGIDIGSVRMVGQIGAPWSVASLKQRMGRSGRRENEPRVLRMYMASDQADPDDDLFDRLHLNLLQAIAVVDLMLEGWTEPDEPSAGDLSTLTQQVLSVISQHGGVSAGYIYDLLCRPPRGAFADVDPALLADLLRSMAGQDLVEQMAEGDLILGLNGERLRKDKGFYAVFQTPEEFAVLHDGRLLGTLELVPQEGDRLLFAGRRWQVAAVDVEKHELHVQPAKGWKRPRFMGGGGEIHPMIRRRMRELLRAANMPSYLDETAAGLLDDARAAAAASGACTEVIVPLGPKRTAVMTWTGTRIQATLSARFAHQGHGTRDESISLVFSLGEAETRAVVKETSRRNAGPLALATYVHPRLSRKYDRYLTPALLDHSIACGRLDPAAADLVLRWLVQACE